MPPTIIVCVLERSPWQNSCGPTGGLELLDLIKAEVAKQDLKVEIKDVHCLGNCEKGPNIRFAPGGPFLSKLTTDDLPKIMETLKTFLAELPPA